MDKETEALFESLSISENGFKKQLLYLILKENPLENFKKTKEKLFELIDFEKHAVNAEYEQLKDKYAPDILEAMFEDSDYENEQFASLVAQFCVGYLASIYENKLKTAFKIFLGNDLYTKFLCKKKSKIYSQTIIDEFKKYNIDIEKLNSFKNVDELRLINNCFKHNDGLVSKELQNHPDSKWHEGEKINLSEKDIDTYSQNLEKFFFDLATEIETYLDSKEQK